MHNLPVIHPVIFFAVGEEPSTHNTLPVQKKGVGTPQNLEFRFNPPSEPEKPLEPLTPNGFVNQEQALFNQHLYDLQIKLDPLKLLPKQKENATNQLATALKPNDFTFAYEINNDHYHQALTQAAGTPSGTSPSTESSTSATPERNTKVKTEAKPEAPEKITTDWRKTLEEVKNDGKKKTEILKLSEGLDPSTFKGNPDMWNDSVLQALGKVNGTKDDIIAIQREIKTEPDGHFGPGSNAMLMVYMGASDKLTSYKAKRNDYAWDKYAAVPKESQSPSPEAAQNAPNQKVKTPIMATEAAKNSPSSNTDTNAKGGTGGGGGTPETKDTKVESVDYTKRAKDDAKALKDELLGKKGDTKFSQYFNGDKLTDEINRSIDQFYQLLGDKTQQSSLSVEGKNKFYADFKEKYHNNFFNVNGRWNLDLQINRENQLKTNLEERQTNEKETAINEKIASKEKEIIDFDWKIAYPEDKNGKIVAENKSAITQEERINAINAAEKMTTKEERLKTLSDLVQQLTTTRKQQNDVYNNNIAQLINLMNNYPDLLSPLKKSFPTLEKNSSQIAQIVVNQYGLPVVWYDYRGTYNLTLSNLLSQAQKATQSTDTASLITAQRSLKDYVDKEFQQA
jgi:hypothetical protein